MAKPTLAQLMDVIAADNYIGFCRACAEEHSNCEPDTQREKCRSCGNFEVFGAEQLLMMGAFEEDE